MNKLRLGIAALISGLVLSQGAMAHGERGDRGERGHRADGPRFEYDANFDRRALRGLELTEEQREQIKGIVELHRDQHKTERDEVKAARDNLRQLAQDEALDQSALIDAANELAMIEARQRIARINLLHEMKQVLNEEQRAELAARRER